MPLYIYNYYGYEYITIIVMFWEIKKFSFLPDFLLTNLLGCGIMEISARAPARGRPKNTLSNLVPEMTSPDLTNKNSTRSYIVESG